MKKNPKEQQEELTLNKEDLFNCLIEFWKIFNKRCQSRLNIALHLLESMKNAPKAHPDEWSIWEQAIADCRRGSLRFVWDQELPAGPFN